MIIQSGYLTEGLFGEALTWMLELLPYIKSNKLKPAWNIRSRNYGTPPTYNIFPGIIQTTYTPDPDPSRVESFEKLQAEHGYQFQGDFQLASRHWHSYLRFTDDVYDALERFLREHRTSGRLIGVQYRGTDKNADPGQTNPISRSQFLVALEDFLTNFPDATTIFVATDDAHFVHEAHSFLRGRWQVLAHPQRRSEDEKPLFNNHFEEQNLQIAKSAILDCLTLSRCSAVLATMSALSAFAKVLNPEVEVYRAASCRPNWFPVAYTRRYKGQKLAVRAMLARLQIGDWASTPAEKVISFPDRAHRKLMRMLAAHD